MAEGGIDFSARLVSRSGYALAYLPRFQLTPVSYSHHARGGPERAEIVVQGDPAIMPILLDWLRCPVVIYADGNPVWWGFVNGVQFNGLPVQVQASLDRMANRVAVLYVDQDGGCLAQGFTVQTPWADDLPSQREFGTREIVESIDDATAERAESTRDRALDIWQQPIADMRLTNDSPGTGVLYCQGWFETAGWKYYRNLTTGLSETSAQMDDIASLTGQFFTSVTVQHPSNILSDEYRDGDNTGLMELMRLMDTGVNNATRYLATVDQNLGLLIYQEPASNDAKYQVRIDAAGRLVNPQNGNPLPPGSCPAGVWLDWLGSIPETAALNFVARPVPVFIEQMEINCATGQFQWLPRGVPDPWQKSALGDG